MFCDFEQLLGCWGLGSSLCGVRCCAHMLCAQADRCGHRGGNISRDYVVMLHGFLAASRGIFQFSLDKARAWLDGSLVRSNEAD